MYSTSADRARGAPDLTQFVPHTTLSPLYFLHRAHQQIGRIIGQHAGM